MANRTELRLAGSGGQGIILASIILAEAAVIAGKNVAQTQSYGPEARGGMCKAEVVISDGEIGFFKVQKPTLILALTQLSLDQYTKGAPESCVIVADESLDTSACPEGPRIIRLPILRTANETVGKAFTANIVAIGAVNRIIPIASDAEIRQAVGRHIPKGTEEINFKALDLGSRLENA